MATEKTNKRYQVFGDMTAEKSSDAYPELVLCEDCVANYKVVTTGQSTSEPCEECGAPDNE